MPRISALPPNTSPDGNDELPGVDDSTNNTIKWTLTTIKTWLQSLVGWITTAMLADESVTSQKLAPGIIAAYSGADTSTNLVLTHAAKVVFMFSTQLSNSTSGTDSYGYLKIDGVNEIVLRRRTGSVSGPDITTPAGFKVKDMAAGTYAISTSGSFDNRASWVAIVISQ